jgi:large subunit ribosomal protein L22
MKAYFKNYRQSPRKVRLVANLIKGKDVNKAIAELDFLAKRASTPLKKILLSAVANAKNMGLDQANLYIKEFTVDKGVTIKRMRPAAMGSAHRINKRTSNLAVILGERVAAVRKSKVSK